MRRTFKFSCKLFLEILAGAITLMAVLAFLFILFISQKSISLNKLTPYFQDALKNVYPELEFKTQESFLSFEDGNFKIQLKEIEVPFDDKSFVHVGGMSLFFSFESILQKIPSKIEINSVRLQLTIDKEGQADLNLFAKDPSKNTVKKYDRPIYQTISENLTSKRLSALKEISLEDMSLTLSSELWGEDIKFKNTDILFKRDKGNVVGLSKLETNDEKFKLFTLYDAAKKTTNVKLTYDTIDISTFANRYKELENFKINSSGAVIIKLNETFGIDDIIVDGYVNKGSYAILNKYFDDNLPISGKFAFSYKNDLINTNFLDLNINDLETSSKIFINLSDKKDIDFKIYSRLKDLPVKEIKDYWPKNLITGTRGWITNHIIDGNVKQANITLNGKYKRDNEKDKTDIEKLSGDISLEKLEIEYLDTMPSVKNINGFAKFDLDGFNIDVFAGNTDDVNIKKGTVTIPFENTIVKIDTDLNGSLNDVAKIIDSKPLEYIKRAGLDSKKLHGNMDGNLKLDIPVSGENIKVKVSSNVNNVKYEDLIFNQDLTQAFGLVKVDNSSLNITGSTAFENANLYINWTESFEEKSKADSMVKIDGTITPELLKELDILGLHDSFKGPIPIDMTYTSKNKKGDIKIKSDLKGAELDLSPIPYKNAKDDTADFSIDIALENNDFKEIKDLKLKDDEIDLSGWFNGKTAFISKLKMPEKNIDIKGNYSNLALFPNADISGTIGNQASLKIYSKSGINYIDLQVENLGNSLKSLEITDKVHNGVLSLKGKSLPKDASRLQGRLHISNFNVTKLPLLAKLFGALSLSGLSQSLSGQGLVFDNLSADFIWDYEKQQFIFNQGKTTGSSLGMTFENIWDIKNNTIAMQGTVVVLQGINQVIKNIPLIGHLLTGAKKEGVFGQKYKITGKLSDPKVEISTASTFAPGFLRDLFFWNTNLEEEIEKENQKYDPDYIPEEKPKTRSKMIDSLN